MIVTAIVSNAPGYGVWHLGRTYEIRGARTGTLHRTYQVAACSGRSLGGAWGQTQARIDSAHFDNGGRTVCQRCVALLAKRLAAEPDDERTTVDEL